MLILPRGGKSTEDAELNMSAPWNMALILWGNDSMGRFLKRLFCRHDYDWKYLHMVNGGMAKLYRCTCKKCGKVRYKT